MLMQSRVDAVFIAELLFEAVMKKYKLQSSQFKKYIEVEKPFGIYMSKNFLAKHPEALTRINSAIEESIMTGF